MKKIKEVSVLISVGVDVSKGKSTVCILKPYGEVLMSPNDYEHTQRDLKKLVDQMDSFEDEIHLIYKLFQISLRVLIIIGRHQHFSIGF